MNIKPNIGILNALIRITVGLTLLSWCTAKLVKFPWRDSYLFVAMCGAMKVAEGIVRFCPVTAIFDRNQEMNLSKQHPSDPAMESREGMEGLTTFTDQPSVPYNPS